MDLQLQKHKNIVRMDNGSTHGWYVRINSMRKQYSKMFTDPKNGGVASALLSAIAWRDRKKISLGLPITELQFSLVANNNTGVRGVRWDEKGQRFEVNWVYADGRPGHTTCSATKHGKDNAFKMACDIRNKKESARLSGDLMSENDKQMNKFRRKDPKTYSKEDLIEVLLNFVRREKRKPTPNDLRNYCREHLAAYKVPRAVQFVEDFPKTSSGKIMRRKRQELLAILRRSFCLKKGRTAGRVEHRIDHNLLGFGMT